jgi:copper oxidase (laccase) domain-containing protein
VGKDVAEQFQTAYQKSQIKEILLPGKSSEKYQLNLQMANYYNMRKAGISPEHIYISDLCTCCNSKQLFSHRASKGQRGVLCGFMYIRS